MAPFDKKKGKTHLPDKGVKEHALLLHNDDINTFDYVIDSLQEICGHNGLQAEQCALLTHMKGVCEIKKGAYTELLDLQNLLISKQLLVTID